MQLKAVNNILNQYQPTTNLLIDALLCPGSLWFRDKLRNLGVEKVGSQGKQLKLCMLSSTILCRQNAN